MSQVLTRDDVFLSKPRTLRVPGIVRCTLTVVTVAGRRYEILTIKSWLIGRHTKVHPSAEALVELDTADTEPVVAALLDVLNGQAAESR